MAIYHSHECRRCNHGPRFAHPRLRAPATGTPGPGPGNSSLVVIPSALLFKLPVPGSRQVRCAAALLQRALELTDYKTFKPTLQLRARFTNHQAHDARGLDSPRPRRLTGPGMVWLTTMHGLASTPRPLSPHFLPRSLGRNAAKTPNMTRSRLLGPFASFESLINC